ncbi:hypothetical protein ACJ41O_003707 [Fusarium nematophilum]
METLDFSRLTDSPVALVAAATAATAATAACIYALYRRLLPKPIPGIPYNAEAASSVLGDVPTMIRETGDGSSTEWILAQPKRHPGPMCQVFLQPLGKPFVLLSDYREAQDIFLRRTHEWDRSEFSIEILSGAGPSHHINMKTGPEWKAHRRLLQDLMTPAFLHNVAAPNIHNSVLNLVEFWDLKSKASGGNPFTALHDIYDAAMDAVLEFSFGSAYPHRAILPQLDAVRTTSQKVLEEARHAAGEDGAVEFPRAAVHETIQATFQASKAVGEVLNYVRPRFGWWLKKLQPSEVAATRVRRKYIKEQIDKAAERLRARSKDSSDGDTWVKSAIDLMLDRETKFAAKEGREPVYWSPAMRDEAGSAS